MVGRHLFAASILLTAAMSVSAQSKGKIEFARDVEPILEKSCVNCHHSGTSSAQIELTSRKELLDKGVLTPGKPDESAFYVLTSNGQMPPNHKLPEAQIAVIRRWIEQGAAWPAEIALKREAAQESTQASQGGGARELEEVGRIHDRIAANTMSATSAKAYKVTLPNTTVAYDMVAIPAGQFTMGAPGKTDEQPPHKVEIPAFWMQAHEVTWDEYRLFMFANQAGDIAHKDDLVDAVSRPTRPYVEMSFGMGINGFPAISMTQHAANKYAEWLSSKTGEFYRLPTEAEWEYACRAEAAPQPAQLADDAWFAANSGGKYQKVATKKPNAWGLFDMLGNVMEWTLDQYEPYKAGEQIDPWIKPKQPYPIAVRGGSWNDPADAVTCVARVASDASWKQQDPQLPKSIWYETDAQWLGFRLVRPAALPTADEMYRYWNNGVEHDEQ